MSFKRLLIFPFQYLAEKKENLLSCLFSLKISIYQHNISIYQSGLEKSSVLPVLDRFFSLKTDFVLNRKQKNRSIKIRFFPSNSKDSLYNSYLSRQFTVNFTPFNTLTCLIRLYTHMYYMTSGCHQLITPMSE